MRTAVAVLLFGAMYVACALPTEDETVVRERRFVSRVENLPKRPQSQFSGSVDGNVGRDRRVGTMVHARGDGVWTSADGNTKVGAGANWGRVYNGPAAGRPSKGGYINVEHRFPGK